MGIRDEELEGGLFEAFKTPESTGGSVLDRIEHLHGAGSSVLLRETDEDVSPVLIRREDESLPKDDPRYQILGELARGGIGIIYRGRDKDLNRDIALKVLRPEYAERADVVQRFVEEAQVAGQLQHPGIVPVYGLGLQEDGRPSFAMKLIKGRTLAELLDSNPRGLDLIAIFEQIAQTLGYAHSRGVIHRDLKPANVMIGAFGEVQVVDWGFAKVLGQEESPRAPDRTVIATIRSGPVGSQSVAGSVMGTPAYMPPEQALGRVDELDERTDVFALGAILCEILSGSAPYTGEPKDQLIAAVQCLLAPAHERLDAADAPEGLKEIVRDCLRPLSAERPKNARILAERITAHLASVEARAQQAELDALDSEREAQREQHARRRTLSVGASALFALLAGGGGYLAWKSDRESREARAAPLIASALRQATRFEGEGKWTAAVAATQKAIDLAASHGVPDAGASALLAGYERERDAADVEASLRAADRRLLLALEEVRMRGADHYILRQTDAAFVAAVARRWPDMQVDTERLAVSPDAVRVAAAFDVWARVRQGLPGRTEADWRKIDALARAIHPQSNDLRDAMLARDAEAIEAHPDLDALPVTILVNLSGVLFETRRDRAALALLRRAHRRHPDDFLVNCGLGAAAARIGRNELAVQHCAAALALRPESIEARHRLGVALSALGDHAGALRVWQEALAQQPRWFHGTGHVAAALSALGRREEARRTIEEAVATMPDDGLGHYLRGSLYERMGDSDAAIAAYREAVSLDPGNADTYRRLAGQLVDHLKAFEEAIEIYGKALDLQPDYARDHACLGKIHYQLERFDEAEAAYRKAVQLDETEASGHIGLGMIHLRRGDAEAAGRAFLIALELTPTTNADLANLGLGLAEVGRIDEAEAVLRRALRVNSNEAPALSNLGMLLFKHRNRPTEALALFERGVALKPSNAVLHANRGRVLDALGEKKKAIAAYRRAIALDPERAGFHTNLGVLLLETKEYDEAIKIHEKAVKLDPTERVYWFNLGQAYREKGDVENTIHAFRQALACDPEHAVSNYQLATYLLRMKGDASSALPLLEKTIALDSEYAEAWCNRGSCLQRMGRWAEALDSMRKGHELGSKRPDWSWPSPQWLAQFESMAALAKRLPAVVAGKDEPADPREALTLASMAHTRKEYAAAVRLYAQAFEAAPGFVANLRSGRRYNAACAAVLAGEETHAQALEWLRADLELWTLAVEQQPQIVARAMAAWQQDADFASARDGTEVPAEWTKLWADVKALHKRAQE